MRFGHNTNVTVGAIAYHVQTESRTTAGALIDTAVYCRGSVVHRRTGNYLDLLPLNPDREQALRLRVADQHSTVIQELRSGTLHVTQAPPLPTPVAAPIPAAVASPVTPEPTTVSQLGTLSLDLLNPRTWLTGKHATLYLVVRSKASGTPTSGAHVTARVDGAAEHVEATTVASADGHVKLEFDMPRLAGEESALVIDAIAGDTRGHLRFQLRAKPRVPAAG
jgi:hypothetical protein